MREILFKAKRLDGGDWVEGVTVPLSCLFNSNTLSQYIGGYDREGKKIYDKDVVFDRDNNLFYCVVFDEDMLQFVFYCDEMDAWFSFDELDDIEVIGSSCDVGAIETWAKEQSDWAEESLGRR